MGFQRTWNARSGNPQGPMLKSVEEERKIMATAVLPSNDPASNVVRVIAGVARPRPSLRIYECELGGTPCPHNPPEYPWQAWQRP